MDDTSETPEVSASTITLSSPLFPKTTIQRLHGSLPLATRKASLAKFTEASDSPSILLATSVASRGLDLPLVRAVIQYDLPTEGGANEYVHRVGRTARAGKGGEAWAFVGPAEAGWVKWVEEKMGTASDVAVKGAKSSVRLSEVGVDDVLRKGFGGTGYEFESRATDVQLAFERWVLAEDSVSFESILCMPKLMRCSTLFWLGKHLDRICERIRRIHRKKRHSSIRNHCT